MERNSRMVSIQLSAISYQLSAISYQLSAISYQLSAISQRPWPMATLREWARYLRCYQLLNQTGKHWFNSHESQIPCGLCHKAPQVA
ncbi:MULTISPECIES: hypothetical protein [unclassified Moorena]|nr:MULTISPECIES: hypothetical protein [unclassified Moorena]NEQ18386.1 hypothetical protein [Moorena sp. SIO3E2]NET67753.1 hypothetical protein [Moorena sp. SIO1G6]NEP32203.1 hypothetical protein [Moorena sp. SIO3B2]NER88523.1 hypothetical protein [Moorena sp. SIO3A2]NES45802.1 hypothetical protein [Moorena sp. SIO2C4]